MLRRWGLVAVLGSAALAACEPANEAQRVAMHWQACQTGLADPQRLTACTAVVTAPELDMPQRVQALVARGNLYAELRQDSRAFADYGQALRFDAANTGALIQRGLLHQRRGAFGAAVVDFTAADRLDPASAGADYVDDAIAAEATAYRTQIQRLDADIAADDEDASLYNSRCWERAIVGDDLGGALSDCNRALALAPGEAEYLDSRGLVELKLRNFQAAFVDYSAALGREPTRGHYRYGRALALYRMGQEGQARAEFAQAVEQEPGVDALYVSYGAPEQYEKNGSR